MTTYGLMAMEPSSPSILASPMPGAVLVLERRGTWVCVLDPRTGRTSWVDLGVTVFSNLSAEAAESDPLAN